MITHLPTIMLSTILFGIVVTAGTAGLPPLDVNSHETVILTVTTYGYFQTYSTIQGHTNGAISPLPFQNSRVVPAQICRNWQYSSPVVNVVHRDDGVIILAQLQNGIGLAEFLYNATHSWTTSTTVLILNSFLPHHTKSYNLYDIVYIAGGYTAYASQSGTLYSCDFYANFTNLSGSRVRCSPLDSLDLFFQSSLASNLVVKDDEQVLFAYNGSLYAANYFSYSISYITSLHGALCRRLSYSRSMAYLYCNSNKALRVDLEAEPPIVNVHYLNDSGIPFSCPNAPDVFRVAVRLNHTRVTHKGQSFRTEGTDFYNGQCIEDSQNRPLFYFIDQSSGLYVVNTSSLTVQHVQGACNSTSMCVGLYVFPGLNVVVLRSGLPGELLLYDENLEVLKQEELNVEVAGVSLYTIQRPVTPTATPSKRETTVSALMTTDVFTKEPIHKGTPEGTATSSLEVTDVMSITVVGDEVVDAMSTTTTSGHKVTDAESTLSLYIAIGIIVAAVIMTIIIIIGIAFLCWKHRVSLKNIATKIEICCNGTSQTSCKSKVTLNNRGSASEQKPVAQESMLHCGSLLAPGISCEDGTSKQVISAEQHGLVNSSSCTGSSKQLSFAQETSVFQQLKSRDAKHGYPESEPVTPQNAES